MKARAIKKIFTARVDPILGKEIVSLPGNELEGVDGVDVGLPFWECAAAAAA